MPIACPCLCYLFREPWESYSRPGEGFVGWGGWMSQFALLHSPVGTTPPYPIHRNRQHHWFDLGPCYRYSFPKSQALDDGSMGGRRSSRWLPCQPALLSAGCCSQHSPLAQPAEATHESCQLRALGRGAVLCLRLVNVHARDHGFHLMLMLFLYTVVSSQCTGVWHFLMSPHTVRLSVPTARVGFSDPGP